MLLPVADTSEKSTPSTTTKEQTQKEVDTKTDEPWTLILYNDDVHSFDEVIIQIMKALKCDQEKAENLAIMAHNKGKAVVFKGTFEECFERNTILKEIELITEIKG